ncbi:hypothetical protein TNCV_1860651 [Trichonephila clavipes]|nr:hypothetical protein TNCV_1860651 [Trichonephila clavipes]
MECLEELTTGGMVDKASDAGRLLLQSKLDSVSEMFSSMEALKMEYYEVVEEEKLPPVEKNDEAHFWLNGYVNKQNCRISSEANPQVYVETPLHPKKLTVWCALWAGGILLQKR